MGSSGSVEPLAVLAMVKEMFGTHQVIISTLVTDDDSSIKAKLKWSDEDHVINNNTTEVPTIINGNGNVVDRPNHGGLPGNMPQPTFVADPNHRKKTLKGVLCKLAASRVAD